jgi:hypothetical protein
MEMTVSAGSEPVATLPGRSFRIFALAVAAISVVTLGCAEVGAATIPDELWGKWCAESWVNFSKRGYKGSADSEEYVCDVKRIERVADDTWEAQFLCEGEFGRVRVKSVIRVQELRNERFIAIAAKLKSIRDASTTSLSPLTVYRKCE